MAFTIKTVSLFLIDGMRPDALIQAHTPTFDHLLENGMYTLTARAVMPSITLPCHASLFHSLSPEQHGVTTNIMYIYRNQRPWGS